MKIKLKDPLSGLLHLFGALLSIAALVILLVIGHTDAWRVVSFAIYGSTMILLYSASTLYHWLPKSAGGKNQIFRKFDHCSIYLLIAGTYTPFCLVTLNGPWGWSLFGVIWGFAILGVIVQAVYIDVWRWLTTTIYIVMGWLVIVGLQPLLEKLPSSAFWWLFAGGVVYSIGGVVYTLKKPNLFKAFGYHELWHVMVLLGSLCHFLVMFWFVAP
jgi:hemolysin III